MSIPVVVGSFCVVILLFPVYPSLLADATFRTQISESAISQDSFIRRSSSSDFLSTFPVTCCSEIKLPELSVGLFLLFGACSLDSCWFLLMPFAISW